MLSFVPVLLSNILTFLKQAFSIDSIYQDSRQGNVAFGNIPYSCRAYALLLALIPYNIHNPDRYIIYSMHQNTPVLWCN